MLKEAIEKLVELNPSPIQTIQINERTFINGNWPEILPPIFSKPDVISFSQLSGLVSFAETLASDPAIEEVETYANNDSLIFVIESPSLVAIYGSLQPENFNKRFLYAKAQLNFNHFQFGHFMNIEAAVIGLQSLFVRDENCEAILDLLSNVADEQLVTLNDSGMSQTVNIKTGITTKGKETVPKTVTAAPYRTFPEIDQPSSTFILRFKKSGGGLTCAIFEADGGAWKIEAVKNIAAWLEETTGKVPLDIPIIA